MESDQETRSLHTCTRVLQLLYYPSPCPIIRGGQGIFWNKSTFLVCFFFFYFLVSIIDIDTEFSPIVADDWSRNIVIGKILSMKCWFAKSQTKCWSEWLSSKWTVFLSCLNISCHWFVFIPMINSDPILQTNTSSN